MADMTVATVDGEAFVVLLLWCCAVWCRLRIYHFAGWFDAVCLVVDSKSIPFVGFSLMPLSVVGFLVVDTKFAAVYCHSS
ncbi:hypothetical protein U1Q18_038319 [Sarracenia purpurea var. burkii]